MIPGSAPFRLILQIVWLLYLAPECSCVAPAITNSFLFQILEQRDTMLAWLKGNQPVSKNLRVQMQPSWQSHCQRLTRLGAPLQFIELRMISPGLLRGIASHLSVLWKGLICVRSVGTTCISPVSWKL